MERKIKSLENHISFLYDELEAKECELDDLKKTLDDVKDMCKKKSAHRDKDNEDIVELKNIVEEQRVKITCLRKHREEILDRHEKLIDDYENEFKAKEDDIRCLQNSSKQMKQQISDLNEELSEKDVRFIELQDKITSKEKISEAIQSTQTSLFDEIVRADSEQINVELQTEVDVLKKEIVKSKIQAQKRSAMLQNLEFLQSLNQEKLLKLEETIRLCVKRKLIPKCKYGVFCKRKFCKFDHSFVFRKVNKPASEISCFECGQNMKTNENLKDHMKLKHEPAIQESDHADDVNRAINKTMKDEDSNEFDSNNNSENSLCSSSLEESSDTDSQTESESGEVGQSSENLSISTGGNVTDQLSD